MAQQPFAGVFQHLRRLVGGRTAAVPDSDLLDRFIRNRDETAFAVLVERYGGVVLGVCRRLLRDPHAADDAFQATFLVLARKAAAVRDRNALGSWLYGVAYRVSLEARSREARRRTRERQAAEMPTDDAEGREADPHRTAAWQEARELLDRELHGLPEKYRTPLVLCYLEGKTNEQAAHQLGCATSSLSWRLGKARDLLRQRLSRRGVALSVALVAGLLTECGASAAVSIATVQLTARAAALFAVGQTVLPGVISTEALSLTEGFLRTMTHKLRLALLVVLGGLLAVGTGMALSADQPAATGGAAAQAAKQPPPPAASADEQRDAALDKGLQWLVRQQAKDGSWSLSKEAPFPEGATALAVLALLRADNAHLGVAHPYARNVDAGLKYLMLHQTEKGAVGSPPSMYPHGLAAMALCEASARLGNPKVKEAAQRALDFIVEAQADAGGWRYQPKMPGDTSVTGWQVQALMLGEQAGLKVPAETWTKVDKFLDSVVDGQGLYSYTPGANPAPTMTAAGIFCRFHGGQKPNAEQLAQGYESLRTLPPGSAKGQIGFEEYFYYYATLAMNQSAADAPKWNRAMRKAVLQDQAADGSWGPPGARFGPVYQSTFALLTLEAEEEFRLPVALAPIDLKDAEVAELWCDLAGNNVVQAGKATRKLAAAPRQALPFLREQLRPTAAADPQIVARWIADLDSADFEVRRRADEELEKLGELANSALRKVLEGKPTLEVRQRVDGLLSKAEQALSAKRIQALQAIRILERVGSAEARAILKRLADGAAGALQTEEAAAALTRLDRIHEKQKSKE